MPAARSTPTRRLAVIVLALAAGCDEGDGRQLDPPVFPTPATTTTTIDPASPPLEVTPAPTTAPMQLLTPWPDGSPIPARFTCDDIDVAPPLSWSDVPAGTIELALSMTDIDAGFTHWVVTGIDPTRSTLGEGEQQTEGRVHVNDFGEAAWGGPCPPPGDDPHTYLVTLHALNQQLEVADDAPASDVISLLNQTVLAQASVSGTYARAAE